MKELTEHIKRLTYPQLIALGYIMLIAIGTLLLSLPASSRDHISAGFIGALFTATSATCVTGLVVFDTYTQWSIFGQIIIILLIQIGGLGFMTIITLFSFLLKRKIGLKERGLLRESVNSMYVGGIVRLIKKILVGTLLIEGLGAVLLSIRFIPQMGLAEGIYNGIFHSVSAFCNAGFDITGKYGEYSSLITYSDDAVVCLTIAALIVIGGIGFFVWDDVSKNKLHFKKYQLHTKLVLSMTAILIVVGSVLFYIFENRNTLSQMPIGEKITASVFGAITPRTAGFNSVDVMALTPAAKLLTMLLMFIGGSPGSTAGGIKTITFAVILISLWSSLRNSKGDNIFRRRLEDNALKRASSVATASLILIFCAAFVIGATNISLPIEDVLFECLSAIGTVGLSSGVTSVVGDLSLVILALLMYAGRVGSVSFALLFTEHRVPSSVQSPAEKISLG